MSEDHDRRDVLVRITDNPQLARAVPRLRPEVLHAVIARYGLQDCGDLVALATPRQLSTIFDLDLWKAPHAGADEQFDPARFCEWLEVLVDLGPSLTAARIAHMDPALVVAGVAPLVRVFDVGVFEPTEERNSAEPVLNPGRERGVHAEIGGYLVVARQPDAWDAIVDVLTALSEHEPTTFHGVMRACRRLSDAGHELDGLDDLLHGQAQVRFDLSTARERRRDRLGFLPPEQARAFLESARRVSLAGGPPDGDAVFAAYQRSTAEIDDAESESAAADSTEQPAQSIGDTDAALADVIEILRDGGALAETPRGLLAAADAAQATSNAALERYLQDGAHAGAAAWTTRHQELAFLANALLAGCSVQGRPFSQREAADAVAATCNLGLEYWPARWKTPSGLIAIFQVGWSVLYREVSVKSADALIGALDEIQTSDQNLHFDLRVLRRELDRARQAGFPWQACLRLDVLAPLDLLTWAALTSLFDECPVMLANVSAPRDRMPHRVNPSEFRFIAEPRDVAAVAEFFGSLADLLTR